MNRLPQNVQDALTDKIRAQNALSTAIKDEMAAEAYRRGIYSIIVSQPHTKAYIGGQEVELEIIADLEAVYLDHVNECGFIAIWDNQDGWSK